MWEIRHDGNFVHREESEEAAKKWAEASLKGLDGVSVVPGGSHELHCEDGFLLSGSLEEADAAEAQFRAEKRFKRLAITKAGVDPVFSEPEPALEPSVSDPSAETEPPPPGEPAPESSFPEPSVDSASKEGA